MRVADLKGKKIVIWGLGHEGKAVGAFVRKMLPEQPLIYVDEVDDGSTPVLPKGSRVVRGDLIASTLSEADVLIKSPGVSLYHSLIRSLKEKGIPVTSLLNLWIMEQRHAKIICVTGTKGKSTSSALLTHTLNALGKKAALGGNIGVPVSEISSDEIDYAVIEVSSYQAADFTGVCDIGLLTSLQPEHLDWHGSAAQYYSDKLNLLTRAKTRIVNQEATTVMGDRDFATRDMVLFNTEQGLHVIDQTIYDGKGRIGAIRNAHLARAHNLSNICGVLTVLKFLGLELPQALSAMEDFHGLPHRQQELGEKDGILYVNDSIATAPHAAIAALKVYNQRPTTLIAGGFDRGVDYTSLVEYIVSTKTPTVICMGPSGKRIFDGLSQQREHNIFTATTMNEAIAIAKKRTPKGGVVLLSPAAPSFGLFRDYVERGERFAEECGFALSCS